MNHLMRSLIVLVLGGALVACTPAPETSPTPVPPTPSVTPTPTPQWTAEEQGAIDGVNHYLEVWAHVSQNLADISWTALYEVAREPAYNEAYDVWETWYHNGWHLVGAPTFTATMIQPGMRDGQGQRYWVYGCYDISDAHLMDKDGKLLNNDGGDTHRAKYQVLSLNNGRHLVLEDSQQEGTC